MSFKGTLSFPLKDPYMIPSKGSLAWLLGTLEVLAAGGYGKRASISTHHTPNAISYT